MTDHGFRQGNLAANLNHDDPLDELALIVSGQFERKPKSMMPDDKAFDIEAELIRELDGPIRNADAAPSPPVKTPVRSLATPRLPNPLPAHLTPSLDTSLEDQLMGELQSSGSGSANAPAAERNSWDAAWAEATLESLEPGSLVPQEWSLADSKAHNKANNNVAAPGFRAPEIGDLEREFEKSSSAGKSVAKPGDTPNVEDLDSLAQEFTTDGGAPSPRALPAPAPREAASPARSAQTQQTAQVFSDIDLDFGAAFKTAFEKIESARAAMPPKTRANANVWTGAPERAPETPAPEAQPLHNERSLEEHFASAFAEELELSVAAIRDSQKTAAPGATSFAVTTPAPVGRNTRLHNAHAAQAKALKNTRPVRGPDPFAALLERELQASAPHPDDVQDGQEVYREPRKRGRGLKFASYALAVGAVASLGVVSYGYFRGGENTSEPVLIKADVEPVKIRPNNRGGTEIANQDKAAYERLSGKFNNDAQQEKLVDSAEEPVSIAGAETQDQATRSLGAGNDAGAQALIETVDQVAISGEEKAGERLAPSEEDKSKTVVAIQPRRVKTLSVRPDGTIIAAEANPVVVDSANDTVLSLKADDSAKTDAAANLAIEKVVAADPLKVDTVRVTSEKTGTAVKASVENEAKAVAKTQQGAEPVKTPQVKLASVETQANASAAAVRTEWAVQVSSQKSAEDAEAAYRNLQRKFPQLLEGKQMAVQRADVADKGTFFRVRIQAESKEDAAAFCEKLKAAGGSCFVTR